MTNNLDVNPLLKNDAYLIPFTLKQLMKETELQVKNITNRCHSEEAVPNIAGDIVPNTENGCLHEGVNDLLSMRSEINDAMSDVDFMKELVVYSNGLEKNLACAKLQVDRLNEENTWLSDEINHFQGQKSWVGEKIRDIKTKTAHLAFVLRHRSRLTENISCSEVSELVDISRTTDAAPSRDDGILNETKQPGCKSQAENVTTKITPGSPEDNRSQQSLNDVGRDGGYMAYQTQNTSNSNQVNLSEARHSMANDVRRESKKVRTRRHQVAAVHNKQETYENPSAQLVSAMLSDVDCDTLKRALKSIAFGGTMKSPPPGGDSPENLLHYLLKSDHRATMMDEIKRLLSHYKETRQFSVAFALGSLVLNNLRNLEQELRTVVKSAPSKRSSSREKTKESKKSELPETPVLTYDPEYMKVVDDICHTLSVLASLHFSRQELQVASQLLKECLRLRRVSQMWQRPQVVSGLCQLAFIDAHREELNSAVQHAKKALSLKRELLKMAEKNVDCVNGQLELAKQQTILALFIVRKSHYEQKHARYNRVPLKDSGDIRQLLTKSIRIYFKLSQNVYCGCLSWGMEDLEVAQHQIATQGTPSTLGDNLEQSASRNSENKVCRAEEGLVGVRCVLGVFHILSRRWVKAIRQLNTNMQLIDTILPEGKASKRSKRLTPASQQITRLLKVTTLKGLLYVYRATEQGLKEMEVYGRLQRIDATIRPTDDITENDLINGCQDALMIHEFD